MGSGDFAIRKRLNVQALSHIDFEGLFLVVARMSTTAP
jgi:hypothetical protein